MNSYQHFATVLAHLLGNQTGIRLTVKGYMPLSVEDIVNPPTVTASLLSPITESNTVT